MSSLPKKRFYTLDEYFALVRESDERYEYWDGEIFCMSGGSKEHSIIASNLIRCIGNLLAQSNCQVFTSDLAIKVPTAPPFRYADVSIGCGDLEFEEIGGIDTLVNPIMLIEILSPSNKRFDRNAKFALYKSIPSFMEYLLVVQNQPCITQFVKQKDGSWRPSETTQLENSIYLPSIGLALQLSDVYQRISV